MKTKIEILYSSPDTPGWMKEAIHYCLLRDPIQAANEAEFLAQAMRERVMMSYGATSTKESIK